MSCRSGMNHKVIPQINGFIPILFHDSLYRIPPTLKMLSYAESANHHSHLLFKLDDGFVIEMIVIIMRNQQIINSRYIIYCINIRSNKRKVLNVKRHSVTAKIRIYQYDVT